MSAARNLKSLLQEDLDELRALRDEARLKLHLGSMDAKANLAELEAKLGDLETRLIRDGRAAAINAALRLGNDLKDAFRHFKSEIG